MKKIVNSVLELVGDTPMVELERLGRDAGAVARVVVKVELFNPAGSVKDRVALAMVERAEADGTLRPGFVEKSMNKNSGHMPQRQPPRFSPPVM